MNCQQEQKTIKDVDVDQSLESSIDIFEYLKDKLCLEYISELPEYKYLVFCELQRLNLNEINKKQLDDLTQYVFQFTFEELKDFIMECKEV